ncbi:MAG: FtsL-like putative cell division protein [Rikenellaceae bacterium]
MDEQYEEQELERLRAEREKEEEFRRRVREEIRRVSKGDAQEDILQDDIAREEREQRRKSRQERERRRESNPFWMLISGNVLLHDHVRRGYRYLVILALLFFLSIVTMFTSLHLDLRYGKLSSQVLILREKSLNMQSERFFKTSHSEISRQIKERGIKIDDPTKPRIVVE